MFSHNPANWGSYGFPTPPAATSVTGTGKSSARGEGSLKLMLSGNRPGSRKTPMGSLDGWVDEIATTVYTYIYIYIIRGIWIQNRGFINSILHMLGKRILSSVIIHFWYPPKLWHFPKHGSWNFEGCSKSKLTVNFSGFSGHMASEIATSSTLWLCQNSYWKWP